MPPFDKSVIAARDKHDECRELAEDIQADTEHLVRQGVPQAEAKVRAQMKNLSAPENTASVPPETSAAAPAPVVHAVTVGEGDADKTGTDKE